MVHVFGGDLGVGNFLDGHLDDVVVGVGPGLACHPLARPVGDPETTVLAVGPLGRSVGLPEQIHWNLQVTVVEVLLVDGVLGVQVLAWPTVNSWILAVCSQPEVLLVDLVLVDGLPCR